MFFRTRMVVKIDVLQQKGLEDYKLATVNASINADFSLEEHCHELSHGVAAMTLEAGDGHTKQGNGTTEKVDKPSKEVWIPSYFTIIHLIQER